MDFTENDDHQRLRDGVRALTSRFGDDYWLARDRDGVYPHEFYDAAAEAGWFGLTLPQEFGGQALGVMESGAVMHEVARRGGGITAASVLHINLFGPHAIVVHGSAEQKKRWLPRLATGADRLCFGFTEPDVGLDATRIKTFARKVDGGYLVKGQKVWTSTAQVANKIMLMTRTTRYEDAARPTDGMTLFYTDMDRTKIDARRLEKMGCIPLDSNSVFIDDLFIPDADRIGEEGKGLRYVMDSLNPERILIALECVGIGQDAIDRAAKYAKDRIVFDRPIGQNQGIQHPLAECWMNLEAAYLIAWKAAWLFDNGKPCAAEANTAKLLGSRAGHRAIEQAIYTHGGFGYAKEFHLERMLRDIMMMRLTPVSDQLILSQVAERTLGLPKSY